MPKYQATAYIRLSYTDDRSSESDSVANQRKLIENFIERNPDIQIVSEKIDDGYSGIIFDRPAFKEMMQDITDGKINCVIVKDLSRLGREYIETGRYLRRVFPTYGVRFIAITDNIDTAHEGSGDDLTVSVKNIMNEAYCRDISIKTRTSLDIKRRNGDFVGAFPVYGYMKSEENKNLLVPDPYASRVVRDIFRMRLDGTSALRIATVLNEMGILSPLAYKKNNGFPYAKHGYADKEDCKWSATTIIRILQDETYIGTLVQGKQGTPHYKIKQMEQRPSSEWIRVPDAHEPLIAKQDFELVQRIRRLDTRTSPKQDTVYLFSGVLICGCCGSRMTRKTNRVKGKEYHYYYCPTGKKHGCTNPVMLKESDLVECVKDSLKGYIDNVSCLQAILDGIDQSSINQALANEYASHIAANEQQVEQALEFKARLYESLITGTISKEEYTDYKAKYTRIAENAKEGIRVLKEKLADVLENRSERNRWISHFTQFSTMETLDRKAVVHMIQSIKVIGKKELEITFTYQDEYQKAIQLIQLAEQKRPFYMCRHSTADVNSRCRDVRADVAGLEEAVLLTLKKQLEILLPVHKDGTIHLEATAAKCSEYEKQLEALKDQKQALFERYLLGQIELDTYKSEKAVYDAEILKVKNAYAAVTAQAKLKREEQARQSSRQEIAHSIAEADVLTSELTDLLIEKVYVFPDNRIEIVYKVHDLFE